MTESLPDPERSTPSAIDILLETQRGPEMHTFSPEDIIVRSFGPDWAHMDYIFQRTHDDQRARFMFGFRGLAEFLIGHGFTHSHAPEPTDVEREVYVYYQALRLDREVGGA